MNPTLYLCIVCFIGGMGALLQGYQIGIPGTVLNMKSFKTSFSAEGEDQLSFIKQMFQKIDVLFPLVFTFLSIPPCVALMAIGHRIGRKLPIIAGAILVLAGSLLQTFTPVSETRDNSKVCILFGRAFAGFGTGLIGMTSPVYLSEIAPLKYRGTIGTSYQLLLTLGIVCASIVNAIIYEAFKLDEDVNKTWRVMLGAQMIPCIVILCTFWFLPESPVSLLSRGNEKEALKALVQHRQAESEADREIQEEFRIMKEEDAKEKSVVKASWGDLLEYSVLWRIIVASLLQFFQQWTGINAILSYAGKIFENMGFQNDTVAYYIIPCFFMVNFLATFPGMYLIDRLGRSTLLTIGGYGMTLCFIVLSILFGLFYDYETKTLTNNTSSYLCIAVIVFYFLNFAATWGPVVWTYQSEIFPINVRSKGTGIATMSNFLNSCLVFLIFIPLADNYARYIYILFVFTCFAMGTFAFFCVPETKGLEVSQISDMYSKYKFGRRMKAPSKF